MRTKNSSSGQTILLVLLLIITFPFWIGFLGIAIGVLGGVFGAIFGVFGSLMGVIGTLIAVPFKLLFGLHHWHWWPHFHLNGFVVFILIILAALMIKKNKEGKNPSSGEE